MNLIGGCYICSMIKHDVAQYIEKERLLTPQDNVLVTVSGGADSVALLRILLSLGYRCEAAHCNFHLRGEESMRDERFVRRLCQTWDVPLHVTGFETKAYAHQQKISVEMAARELRYRWFATLAKELGCTAIAVAHHQDDSVETLLLNLIRGTGIKGLLGIRPQNGNIIRPLLCVAREDIIRYLAAIRQDYVIDSTNLEDDYTRNKIRLKLLPIMQEINPSVKENLFRTSDRLNDVSAVYRHTIAEGKTRVLTPQGIRIPALLAEPSPHALLFEILYPLGFKSSQIDDIMRSTSRQAGKQFTGLQGFRVIKDRDNLLIVAPPTANPTAPPFKLVFDEQLCPIDLELKKEKNIAYFDVDKLTGEFSVRKWKQGDTFVPFGMKGRKKISDFLTDLKFSIAQKENQWVLCAGESIIWVIGERTDNRFRIDKSTRSMIVVKVEEEQRIV